MKKSKMLALFQYQICVTTPRFNKNMTHFVNLATRNLTFPCTFTGGVRPEPQNPYPFLRVIFVPHF